ncbi:MAG: hypothetical protein AAFW69_07745, partial [Pseudomonadota bacterium]
MDRSQLFSPDAVTEETRAFNARLAETLAEVPPLHKVPVDLVRQARAEGRGALPVGGPLEGSDWQDIPG